MQAAVRHTDAAASKDGAAAAAQVPTPFGAASSSEVNDLSIRPEDFVFVDNLRLVQPYYFDFKCFVKKRWEGLTLVEMFSKEFPMLTEEYYRRAFTAGRLRVEGRPEMSLSTPLKTSMCVRHLIHRHEPPVLAGEVQVLRQTDEFVAVLKPACMPVHPVGQYRKNTVLGVLEAERPDLGLLHPTYRLDKPVSGLLLLAKTSAAAGNMRKLLEERECSKSYVARVLGRFPSAPEWQNGSGSWPGPGSGSGSGSGSGRVRVEQPESTEGSVDPLEEEPPPPGPLSSSQLPLASGPASSSEAPPMYVVPLGSQPLYGVSVLEDGWLRVSVPLSWDARTNHARAVVPGTGEDSEAKVTITEFRLLSVAEDGVTSVVKCRPKTGRTHQIRVHLQYMGHPIANDTQYGGTHGPPLAFRRQFDAKKRESKPSDDLAAAPAAPTAAAVATSSKRPDGPIASPTASCAVKRVKLEAGKDGGGGGGSGSAVAVSRGGAASASPTVKRVKLEVGGDAGGGGGVAANAEGGAARDSAGGSVAGTPSTSGVRLVCGLGGSEVGATEASLAPPEGAIGEAACEPRPHAQNPDLDPGTSCINTSTLISCCNGTLDPDLDRSSRLPGPDLDLDRNGGTSVSVPDPLPGAAGAQPPPPRWPTGADVVAAGPSHPELFSAFELNNPSTLNPLGPTLPETIRMLYTRDCFRVAPALQEPVCPHCPVLVPFGYPIDLEPLWLYALEYSGPGFAFQAPMPDWGQQGFQVPPSRGPLEVAAAGFRV